MSAREEASETGMRKISLDLSLEYAHDVTASYEPAPPLQTSSNGVAPAVSASNAASDAGMHMSQLLQPQPSVGAPMSYAQDGTASYQQAPAPLTISNGVAPAMRAPKRKRGRPRKYDTLVAMPLATMPALPPGGVPGGVGLVITQAQPALPLPLLLPPQPSANATQRVKKTRVRGPRSTANKHKVTAAGPGVIGLNPEVITIQVGEDVATKVMSYSGNGWAVSVLSAHGVLSNVTLRQGDSIHGTIIYEGHFEILSLSGSYQPSETDGMSTRIGGLGVSLAGIGGRIFGGRVARALIAASPVQVVIGRFPVEQKKKRKRTATSGIPGASGSCANSQN